LISYISTDPAIPDAMGDREGDISTPLLAIADHAGEAWAKRSRRALLDLFGVQAAEEGNAESGTLLLADIRSLFVEKGSDRMPSKELVAALGDMDTRPWPEWKAGKPITSNQLARALKTFRVRPTTYRPAGSDVVVKGYIREDFTAAWNRYLPADPASAAAKGASHPKRGNIVVLNSEFCESLSVTHDRVLPIKISENHSQAHQRYAVTDQSAPDGQIGAMMSHQGAEIGEIEGEL
jgi:hypothetical protein